MSRLAGLAVLLVGLAAFSGAEAATLAPCTAPIARCAEWVRLGGGQARAMVYRTYPLSVPNPRIRRALIVVHGTLRNADHYFATATSAGFLARALGDTLIIAPKFASAEPGCQDKLAPNEVSWSCRGDSWRSGGTASSPPSLTSFDFVDEIIQRLADRRRFPNLAAIVVAGHSAGGQFVSRYEMANRVQDRVGVAISYVVANPSSYAWPDASRPQAIGDGSPANTASAWKDEAAHTGFSYGPFAADATPGYDHWPYGLEHRAGGYTAATSDEALRRQLASRPTTYLLSQVDVLPLGGFDDSPEAMAQGPTRRARGEAFVNYIDSHLGAQAWAVIIPECGHNDRCVFTSETALPVLFPPTSR